MSRLEADSLAQVVTFEGQIREKPENINEAPRLEGCFEHPLRV